MLGAKLLLLCCVVYVSGQGVAYHGNSNVRSQGHLPPRRLPYRPPFQPTAEPLRPVYQPPQPVQPTQPAYQPPGPVYQPLQPVYQPPHPEQPTQPPPPINSPPQPVYEIPTESPASETPLQPIYIPVSQPPAIPSQPRPISNYPRPLPPWSWKPVQPTEAPLEVITEEATTVEIVTPELPNSSPPSFDPKAVDPEAPTQSEPEITSEPVVVLQPETTPISVPVDPVPENPETFEPETPAETPRTDPIWDPEQPTLYPDPLVVVEDPTPMPILYPLHQTPQPPPRPIPTAGPVISQPVSPPGSAPTPPIALPPVQPVLPPRPNYRPIPTAPPQSYPTNNPFQPIQPPRPNPNPPRPLPTQPPTIGPVDEPWRVPTPYPTPVPSFAPVTTQPPQPTSYPVVPTSIAPVPDLPDIPQIIPITNFECRNGNGFYQIVNECDTYIKCENRQAYKYSCPDGLHFNPEALYPDYPCAYPSQVQCDNNALKQIPRPTNECPNRYGFFPISGGDCSSYIMCQEGKATQMNCPFGLVFNERLSSCDWPENVPQCNPQAFNDFTCPAAPEDDPDQLTRYRYGSDCTMYIACQHGHPRWLKCDAGLSFDENSQVCVDSDLVTGCRTTSQH